MAECPYCSASLDAEDRYCPRCGERQSDRGPREGFLDPAVVQYLDGVRNGARAFDSDSEIHERLQTQLATAIGDFGHLAGTDLELRDALDLASATELDVIDPATETDATTQQVLGLAVLLGLVTDAFPETGGDELLAYAHQIEESY